MQCMVLGSPSKPRALGSSAEVVHGLWLKQLGVLLSTGSYRS